MLRVAVVGVGRWGRNHVRVVKELESEGLAELAAVCDVDISRAREIASAFGAKRVASSLSELLSSPIDAAIVATPIDKLFEVGLELVKRGINVLIEKPVATRSSDAQALAREAEKRGVVAAPGFIMRFNPAVQELKRVALRHRIHYAVFRRLSRRPPQARRFPILLDLSIHDIDLCRYVVSRAACSVESASIVDAGIDNVVLAVMRCGDSRCVIHTDGLSLAKVREIELICEDAFIRANTDENTIKIIYPDRSYEERRIVGEEPLKAEDRAFLRACLGQKVEIPTLEDAAEALRVIEQIEGKR